MQIEINRYKKVPEGALGYGFVRTNGCFTQQIRDEIEDLVKEVIKNDSVSCWLGGSIFKGDPENPYYVFGHIEMGRQEKDKKRNSCVFTFALLPFSKLHQIRSAEELMERITQAKEYLDDQLLSIEILNGTSFDIDYQITERLATHAAANETASVEMHGSKADCIRALETIWRVSLFARKMPVVAWVDERSNNQPKKCWRFYSDSEKKTFSMVAPEEQTLAPTKTYLRYAYEYTMNHESELRRYRRMMTKEKAFSLCQEFGRENNKLWEQLLLWYCALGDEKELGTIDSMLPTQEEKTALLEEIKHNG